MQPRCLLALTRTLAMEVGHSVRVNAVSPGIILTPMIDNLIEMSGQDLLASTPLDRNGSPDEVAAAIAFLASDAASYTHQESNCSSPVPSTCSKIRFVSVWATAGCCRSCLPERLDLRAHVLDEPDRYEGLHGDAERRDIDVGVVAAQVAVILQAPHPEAHRRFGDARGRRDTARVTRR